MILSKKNKFRSVAYLASAFLLVAVLGLGEALGEQTGDAVEDEFNGEVDPIEQRLIPPELVVRHGHDIGLTGEQRDEIISIVKSLQPDMMGAELEHMAAEADLIAALDAHPIDEAGADAAATRAMKAEEQIRTSHLKMLIRVRNLLTPEQQDQLRELRGL